MSHDLANHEIEAERIRTDDGVVVEYRPISIYAYLGLLLGMLSIVTWVQSAFLGVAILGACIASFGLAQIAADSRPRLGTKAALWGLGLSFFFGASGVTFHIATYQAKWNHAEVVALEWLNLLKEGDVRTAFLLAMDPRTRPPSEASVDAFLQRPAVRTEDVVTQPWVGYAAIRESEPVASILANPNTTFSTVRRDGSTREFEREVMRLIFQMDRPDTRQENVVFMLHVYRDTMPKSEGIQHRIALGQILQGVPRELRYWQVD